MAATNEGNKLNQQPEIKYISPRLLIDEINEYLKGKRQEQPLAVWCNMPKFLSKFNSPYFNDATGFAQKLNTKNGIVYVNQMGVKSDITHSITNSLLNGDQEAKILILAGSYMEYIADFISYGKDLHFKTEIPVIFLLYKVDQKEFNNKPYFEDCKQIECIDVDSQLLNQ